MRLQGIHAGRNKAHVDRLVMVGGFFATGAVDTTGFHYEPMSFRVRRELSQLAKLSVAGIAVLLSGLVFAAWKLGPW